ncbi:type VI secretion system-associated protein TagO [Rhizobium sp. 32-5/1]|uniref:type VI secretion system-associated protein TagO n=1 Tax=Rhizobium sp. 32-5/1 TaxID=3019602 RepID=UPI00240E84FC|nr:type VI secretion system-associated protein TagO [Rhizobium sp. 32-5/1]WEZ83519.1 type VI secretion system-associated protein TagO [Rhizobium sp. 32-5/1]
MKRIVLAFVFSVAALNGALAAGEECRTVESDLDRLACYDKALGRTPEIKPVVVDAGAWRVDQKTSKMTDQTDIFLSLPSDETIDCGWNNGEKVAMYIRCSESTTALMFITGCHMASNIGDYGNIEYRLDKEKARVIDSEASTDNKALGLWNGGGLFH